MLDSHAHVSGESFDEDRADVVSRARAAGVRWIEVGTDMTQSRRAVQLAEKWPEDILGATVGVHPSDVEADLDWVSIESMMEQEAVVAVGEVGLDYYHTSPKDHQLTVLRRFVDIAVTKNMPVVFHVRSGPEADAHSDMLEFLQSLPADKRPAGVMHTFSGTWEQAQEYLALGMYLSISGVVTFKNSQNMQAVARQAPLERLLIETDCPFLTPEPNRGQRNEPAYVQHVAQKIADLRGVSLEEIVTATEKNTVSLFKL